MNEYLKALEGIPYSEWTKLKIAVDRSFDYKIRELEKILQLSDVGQVEKLIHSQFGQI